MTQRTRLLILLAAGLALGLSACVSVHVGRDTSRAGAYFDRATREIADLEHRDPGRTGRPHRLCVLVYDADEGTIVRVSMPLWLVEMGLEAGRDKEDGGHDADFRKRYDLDWRAVKDLGRYGRGLLVSVEEERSRVLVWLR